MKWLIYNLLFPIAFILLLPRFLYRMCRRGGYASDFMQRLSIYRAPLRERLAQGGWVWVQAVSVGEIFVAFRLMEEIRKRHPRVRFVLTTNTSTGYAIGRRTVQEPDVLLYFPLDFPWIMRRIFRLWRPVSIILIENEMWPNMVRLARRRGIPVVLVNGRISEHSFGGYRRLAWFTRDLLPELSLFCAQSREDAQRLIALGAPAERVQVMGSSKYDVIQADPEGERRAADLLLAAGLPPDAPLLLAASTWSGEEALLLDVFKRLRPRIAGLQLVLAPRHVERREEVLAAIRDAGLTWTLRSDLPHRKPPKANDVFVLDSTGELKHFYPRAEVIFVGKSLTQHGGQNPIEPAFYDKPVITGPHMENFAGIVDDFLSQGALIQVADAAALEKAVFELFADEALRRETGRRAGALVREKAGALLATVQQMEKENIPFTKDEPS